MNPLKPLLLCVAIVMVFIVYQVFHLIAFLGSIPTIIARRGTLDRH